MLYRKIEKTIAAHLKSDSNKIMIINGARRTGKSFIIRYSGQKNGGASYLGAAVMLRSLSAGNYAIKPFCVQAVFLL